MRDGVHNRKGLTRCQLRNTEVNPSINQPNNQKSTITQANNPKINHNQPNNPKINHNQPNNPKFNQSPPLTAFRQAG
jgi:hypothetical protein